MPDTEAVYALPDITGWFTEQEIASTADLAFSIRHYNGMRATFAAFSVEPEAELPRAVPAKARTMYEEILGAVSLVSATREQRGQGARKGFGDVVGSFIEVVGNTSEVVARDLRPFVRSGITDLAATALTARETLGRAADAADRLEGLEERAQVIIDRVGVGRLAKHYEDEAMTQGEAASRWLYGVAACGGLLVAIVIWLLVEMLLHGRVTEWADLGAMLATKALALGVLSFAVSFCAKNYRSHRHLQATYRQRMAALDTYALMASSMAGDEGGRTIVLTELARAVFAPSDTGLTAGSSGDTTVIENTVPMMAALRGQ